jgi:heptose I phosphotransferase
VAELLIGPDLESLFEGRDPFEVVRRLEGEMFREMPGRRTLRFAHAGKRYFLKYHDAMGWKAWMLQRLSFKPLIVGAQNEVHAILEVARMGVSTMTLAAWGVRGDHPSRQESFVITEALEDTVSLEDACKATAGVRPSEDIWHDLVDRLAMIAATLHGRGWVHKDFYICHFLMPREEGWNAPLHLIDLHRMTQETRGLQRWVVKDVAALMYSFAEVGWHDAALRRRFLDSYAGFLPEYADPAFGRAVEKRFQAFCARGVRKGLLAPSRASE